MSILKKYIEVKLPILNKQIVNDKLVVEQTEINIKIDTSIMAQIRFEEECPLLSAKKITLFDYINNLQGTSSVADVACMIKAIYCFIKFEEYTSFIDFAEMFDLSDENYFKKLVERIHFIFNIIFPEIKKNS